MNAAASTEADELARLQALAAQSVTDAHAPPPTLDELMDAVVDELDPSHDEIVELMAATFDMTGEQAIARLLRFADECRVEPLFG